MAEAKGSPTGGAAGGGDFLGGGVVPTHGYQALLASVGTPAAPPAPNVLHHHQYSPAGLIHQPAAMPVPVPPHYASQLTVRPPPPPQQQLCAQSTTNVPQAGYQYSWAPAGSQTNDLAAAAQQVTRGGGGIADWPVMYNGTYMSGSCGSTSSGNNNNGYHHHHQGLIRPCSSTTATTTWPNFMMRNPFYNVYTTATVPNQHQAPSYQSNGHGENSGFASSFSMDPPIASSPCFPPMSSPGVSNNGASVQFFNEATYTQKVKSDAMYTQKVKNSEDPPDMESEKSDELVDHTPAAEIPNLNQGHEVLTARFNCRGYRIVVRKDLTNSDVGNIGRIVMPKRDAEANLPALLERDGMILKMDDFKLPVTWNFKYRFWPNNKSRMYILESTGEFVKSHGLQAGDTLIIYKSPDSYKFLVRGEKAGRQNVPLLCPECKEGNGVEECGFTISIPSKKT